MKNFLYYTLGAAMLLTFTRCTRQVFSVNPVPAPLIHQPDQRQISGSISAGPEGIYSANLLYAQSLNAKTAFYGTANWGGGNFETESFSWTPYSNRSYSAYFGLGRFKYVPEKRGKKFDNGFVFEGFGGFGLGRIYTVWESRGRYSYGKIGGGDFRYVQPFIQGNFGFVDPDMDAGLAFRASYLRYYNVALWGDYDAVAEDYELFSSRTAYFGRELTLHARLKYGRWQVGGYVSETYIDKAFGFQGQVGLTAQYQWNK